MLQISLLNWNLVFYKELFISFILLLEDKNSCNFVHDISLQFFPPQRIVTTPPQAYEDIKKADGENDALKGLIGKTRLFLGEEAR